jgi:hypothetical protein
MSKLELTSEDINLIVFIGLIEYMKSNFFNKGGQGIK